MASTSVEYDYDFFVIGGGSGGVRAARVAASHGAKVALAEQSALGGTCVNVGCVPKKLYVHASEFAAACNDAVGFGWQRLQPRHDWKKLRDAVHAEVARLSGIYGRMLTQSGVHVLQERASLLDAHRVLVGSRELSAKYILVATGSRPLVPKIPGCELPMVSDAVFDLEQLPQRILIVGGGYIAVEFASIFHAFGAKVTLAYRGQPLLRGFDACH